MTFDSLHLYFTDATGTHTETSTKRMATREPTCRSSTGSEISTERIATRATRAQSGMETEREPSTVLRATRAQSSEYTYSWASTGRLA